MQSNLITVETTVNLSADKVWELFTNPVHITRWCSASPEWHAPEAENDLRPGGRFRTKMAARDGSMSFDFGGVYSEVESGKMFKYRMDDNRTAEVYFREEDGKTVITETFEAESQNPTDLQKTGWQAILDNFKKYAEASE